MATEEKVIYSFEIKDAKLTDSANKMKKAVDEVEKSVKKYDKSLKKSEDAHKKASKQADEMAQSTTRVEKSSERASGKLEKVEKATTRVGKAQEKVVKGKKLTDVLDKTGKGLDTVANKLKPVGIGIVAVGAMVTKAGIDFESAVAGVAKTTDMGGKELEDFTNNIREMAKVIPMSTTELLEISEIAGQLGVRGSKDLTLFTETMAHLGVATNMTGEEASVVFGQISAITKLKVGEMPNLASAIVEMGNNSKTTERDIANMLLRLASGAKIIGISEQDMVGWATAIASTGMSAELGGSAFSRFGNIVEKAVASGGSKLEGFAKVAGMSADEFKTAFEQDASGALLEFVKGLEKVNESGGSVTTTLSDLGLKEMGVSTMLKNLSGNTDDLTKYIDASNKAWTDNTALTDEANIKYATLESQLKMIWNTLKDSLIVAFEALAPVITEVVAQIKVMADKFNEFMKTVKPETIQMFAKALLGIVVAIPVLKGLGKAFTGVSAVMKFFGVGVQGTSTAMLIWTKGVAIATKLGGLLKGALLLLKGAFAFLLTPIGMVVAVVAVLVAGFIYLWNTSEAFRNFFINMWNTIKEATMNAVEFVGEKLSAMGTFFTELYNTYVKPMVDAIVEAWNYLGEFFMEMYETYIASTIETVIEAWTDFKDSIIETWEMLVELLTPIIESIVTYIVDAWTNFMAIVMPIIKTVTDFVTSVWQSVVAVVTPIIQTFVQAIVIGFQLLGQVASIIFTAISTVIKVIFVGAVQYAKAIIGVAMSVIGGAFKMVGGVISAILGTASGIIRGFGQIVRAIFQGDITGILNGFKTVFSSVINGIGGIFSSVFGGFVGIAQGVVDSISGFFTGLKDKVGGILSSINPFKSAIEVQHALMTASPFGSGGYTTNETNFTFNVSQTGQTTASTINALKEKAKAGAYS